MFEHLSGLCWCEELDEGQCTQSLEKSEHGNIITSVTTLTYTC